MVLFLWSMNFERQELEKYLDLGHDIGRFWVKNLLWLDEKVARAHKFQNEMPYEHQLKFEHGSVSLFR